MRTVNPRDVQQVVSLWKAQCALGEIASASRGMYRIFHGLRNAHAHAWADALLVALDVTEFPATFLLGVLTITASAAERLANRQDFYERVHAHLTARHGEDETAEMLAGLACQEGWTVQT